MSDDEDSRHGDDTGAGSRDAPDADDLASKAIREASLRERLQAQLAQLRTQVRRLNQALAKTEDAGVRAFPPATEAPPADDIASGEAALAAAGRACAATESPEEKRADAGSLAGVTSLTAVGIASGEAVSANPQPVSADRHGALVLLEINETDLRAMIQAGLLVRSDVTNPAKISAAVRIIVARWRATIPLPLPPLAGEKADRRSGRERRRGAPRSSSLLSYVTGTDFDRRSSDDRRTAKRTNAADESPPPPPNLVTLADARAKRLSQQRRRANPTPTEASAADAAAPPIRIATTSPIRRRGAPVEGIDRVKSKRKLDECEAGPDRITEDKDSREKVTGRGDFVKETESGELNPPGGGGEQEKH